MRKSKKTGILPRTLARKLTPEELKEVDGGRRYVCTDCRTKPKVTTKDLGVITVCDATLCESYF